MKLYSNSDILKSTILVVSIRESKIIPFRFLPDWLYSYHGYGIFHILIPGRFSAALFSVRVPSIRHGVIVNSRDVFYRMMRA